MLVLIEHCSHYDALALGILRYIHCATLYCDWTLVTGNHLLKQDCKLRWYSSGVARIVVHWPLVSFGVYIVPRCTVAGRIIGIAGIKLFLTVVTWCRA